MNDRQTLLREVFARHSTPFAYGGAECVALARDAFETLTGRKLELHAEALWGSAQHVGVLDLRRSKRRVVDALQA